jgi:5-methylcytosine-specific restriction enzyme subunit McrC
VSEIGICLREWEHREPELDAQLAGLEFEDPSSRTLARELSVAGRLEILELAQGISIRATSYVGRVRLGRLLVTVEPKITGMPLLTLLRYAYGLRNLDLFPSTAYDPANSPFQELLVHQLAAEVAELLSRGLHREYTRTRQALASPRGRVDFNTYTRQAGTARAALPCVHHPRLAATLLNRVLLAGLCLGVQLTNDLPLRAQLRRLAEILELDVEPVTLDGATLARSYRALDRRTAAYRPAITLIEMLLHSIGLLLEGGRAVPRVPGFLFDMNRFFQALLARFLDEHLAGYTVREERRIMGMMAYVPEHNPLRRRSPEPRPDYVIQQDARTAALLDAKYRDLWEHSLPRDMLYQLAIYSLSQGAGARAAILYPTLEAGAREARIVIRDPVYGDNRAYVVLRPVDLYKLSDLVGSTVGHQGRRACEAFAHYLAFGEH